MKDKTKTTANLRALELIEFMTYNPDPISITEISKYLGITRTTAYSLIDELHNKGYVLTTENKKIALSSRIFELGNAYRKRYPIIKFMENSNYDFINDAGDTVKLTALSTPSRAVILFTYSIKNVYTQLPLGYTFPLYTSASGKVLLAYANEADRNKYLDTFPKKKLTDNTITSREHFEAALNTIRGLGYATDNEEYVKNQYCIAVPVKLSSITGEIGAISVSGDKQSMQRNKDMIVKNLKIFADIISNK